jgi:hypothetical protein
MNEIFRLKRETSYFLFRPLSIERGFSNVPKSTAALALVDLLVVPTFTNDENLLKLVDSILKVVPTEATTVNRITQGSSTFLEQGPH